MILRASETRPATTGARRKVSPPAAVLALATFAVFATRGGAIQLGHYDPAAGLFDEPADGLVLNDHIGAGAFYDLGYWGAGVTVASIEGEFADTNNAPLGQGQVVRLPGMPDIVGSASDHATSVVHTINGRGPGDLGELTAYNAGIAPLATVWSGAMAVSLGERGAFDLTWESAFLPYVRAVRGWSPDGGAVRTAEVVNSSWGADEMADGNDDLSRAFDALAAESGAVFVVAAGNTGATENPQVVAPGGGQNTITVGALSTWNDATPYTRLATFSSRSPSDFFLPSTADGSAGMLIPGVRARVDVVAPGDAFMLAKPGGGVWENTRGTSFSAPTVAGGLALMVEAGKDRFADNPRAIDARVLKAVLMTSANRNLVGWNNGQRLDGRGVITTSQSLDYLYGAGAVELRRAADVYLFGGTSDIAGTVGGGVVANTHGWDFATTGPGMTTVYAFENYFAQDHRLAVTLTWFSEALLDVTDSGGTDFTFNASSYGSFFNLDLEIWARAPEAGEFTLFGESVSLYNSTEFLELTLEAGFFYQFRVRADETAVFNFTGATETDYAVAWSLSAVPEPAGAATCVGGLVLAVAVARRRHRPRV